MTILAFVVITFGAATLSVLSRPRSGVSLGLGLIGLAAGLVVALAVRPGEQAVVGEGVLVASAYLRLFLVLGSATGLLLCVLGLATAWQRNVPAAILAGMGALAVALSLQDPSAAVAASVAAGLVGILVSVVTPITAHRVQVASLEYRAVAVSGALAILATAWIARPLAGPAFDPALAGLAYLAMAAAVAIRFGAIPFHVWAARLPDSAPEVALPLLMAWLPAGLAVVGLAWTSGVIATLDLPLGTERGLVVAVGVLTLVLGAFAAWIQDDVEHLVGYSILQDSGFVILALTSLDPEAAAAGRMWLLIFVLVKTAFAAWALALRSAYGTRRIDQLSGWARRAPLLGVAFVLIVVGTVGLPGWTSFMARDRLIGLAIDGPFRVVAVLGALSSLAYYARLAFVGIARPGAAVADGPDEAFRLPLGFSLGGRSGAAADGERASAAAGNRAWASAAADGERASAASAAGSAHSDRGGAGAEQGGQESAAARERASAAAAGNRASAAAGERASASAAAGERASASAAAGERASASAAAGERASAAAGERASAAAGNRASAAGSVRADRAGIVGAEGLHGPGERTMQRVRDGIAVARRLDQEARPIWALNRTPIGAVLVLTLSLLAVLVAVGGFGGPAAAAGAGPPGIEAPAAGQQVPAQSPQFLPVQTP